MEDLRTGVRFPPPPPNTHIQLGPIKVQSRRRNDGRRTRMAAALCGGFLGLLLVADISIHESAFRASSSAAAEHSPRRI
jgi:hypothetical protein